MDHIVKGYVKLKIKTEFINWLRLFLLSTFPSSEAGNLNHKSKNIDMEKKEKLIK